MTLDLGPSVKALLKEALREVLLEMRASGEFAPLPNAEAVRESSALLTVEQVAEHCVVEPETVRDWIHAKKLTAHKPGHRYLVDPADLKRFLAEAPVGEKSAVNDDIHLGKIFRRIKDRRTK
jgi:excisionase family DNA binding protein